MPPSQATPQPMDHLTRSEATLSIGELAERAGVKPATLRMWEARHGFPQAQRRMSGHRRYAEVDVELVRQVLRRQEAGARLEVAIAEAALTRAGFEGPPGAPSVYAAVHRRHPALQPHRLRKSTLMALSWAIEDECCARAERPAIFGGFQQERYFRTAEERWTELARIARSTMVFADFADGATTDGDMSMVPLPRDSPMRREWAVVCDAREFPAMLSAWELPGQSSVPDRQRLFEAIWTIQPGPVRDAARTCAHVAHQLGVEAAAPLLYELAENPPAPPVELVNAAGLLNRVISYVDATGAAV